jgi:calcium-dependent protein kinase
MLSSHPNVAALVAIYEDPAAVHMILELCEGGQLFDAIAAAGRTSERAVARHFRRMVEVVQHCHTLGIAHRDIKPDNFLLTQPGPGGVLKAADFGLSQFFRPGRNFKSLVGSAYYVAPEVLARDYGPKADIWSLGVCLHILLSGEPPFWGDTEEEVFAMVRGAPLDFGAPPWPALSPPARDVVRRCLDRDPRRRPSAAQLLQHAWLCQAAPDVDLGPGVVAAVAAFAAATRVKRAAMMVAAQGLGPDRLPQIHALFASLDADGSGALSAEEVRVGLERAGVAVGAAEVKAMVRASGLRRGGGAGLVSLAQFVAATLGHSEAQRDEFAQGLFDGLDADGAGRVPAAALPAALAAYGLGAEEAAAAAAAMGAAPGGSVAAEDFKRWLRGAPSSLQEAVRRRYTEPESPRLDRALGVGGGVEG